MVTTTFEIRFSKGDDGTSTLNIRRRDSYLGDKEAFPGGTEHQSECLVLGHPDIFMLKNFLEGYLEEGWG